MGDNPLTALTLPHPPDTEDGDWEEDGTGDGDGTEGWVAAAGGGTYLEGGVKDDEMKEPDDPLKPN